MWSAPQALGLHKLEVRHHWHFLTLKALWNFTFFGVTSIKLNIIHNN